MADEEVIASFGDHKPLVGQVQIKLLRLGYYEVGEANCRFGPELRGALARYLRERGLPGDGMHVTRRAWETLRRQTEPRMRLEIPGSEE